MTVGLDVLVSLYGMWRTALAMVVLVAATVALGIPALIVAPWVPARWVFDPLFRLWAFLVLASAGVKLTVEGADNIAPNENYFFVGNHQSALDIPVMVAVTRGHIRFMAKKSLFRIPIFGWCMHLNGFVPVDRSSARQVKQRVDQMLQRLSRMALSLLVFPEGTRTPDGSIGPFKHGALSIAQRSGMPLLPFALVGLHQVLKRKSLRLCPGPVRVLLGPPLAPQTLKEMSSKELSSRVRAEVLGLYEPSASLPVGLVACPTLPEGGRP